MKELAGITMIHCRLIARLTTGYTQLLGLVMPLLPEQERALALLSEREQIEGILAEALASIPQTKRNLGLE